MSVRKTDHFIADIELQYQWYAERAGWEIADQDLAAVEGIAALIERQPLLGPTVKFAHPRLTGWRFSSRSAPSTATSSFTTWPIKTWFCDEFFTALVSFPSDCSTT